MIKVRSIAKSRLRVIVTSVVVAFLVIWLGVPTFKKWRADRLVDELCAKDGGITVYQTVERPPDTLDSWGRIRVPHKRYMNEDDEFYYDRNYIDIIGDSSTSDVGNLTVFKSVYRIFRKRDQKLLGESVQYARRGGDPVGPWHPSSYSCRQRNGLESRIFQKAESS